MIKIYQCYYKKEQVGFLDPAFIPFDNTSNENPDLLEYALHKKIYKFTNPEDYWGMVSWRWKEKTGNLSGAVFQNWIESNPGYDVYHFNPSMGITANFDNCFTEGDLQHPGMMNFINRFLQISGIDLDMREVKYPVEYFTYANYYIGNRKFWNGWMSFVDSMIEVSRNDAELNHYLFVQDNSHRDRNMKHFLFVFERILSLFLYLNRDYKVLNYPFIQELMLRNGHSEKDGHNYDQMLEKLMLKQ